MSLETFTANISTSFLSYLINADASGIEPEEVDMADRFCQRRNATAACPTEEDIDASKAFARCEICGLLAECVEVTFVRNQTPAPQP